ncbi:hypothetical protein P22_0299 [Propionispora sp. 2/2-37]|nr:hypothetical protein P22_0299 [Propionispora sp. 2/2-37]
MIFATEYLGSVGVGATSPHFFCASDDQVYVVKMQNNRYGTKVLISELIAAQIGKLLNLCFPHSQLIKIEESFLNKYPHLKATGLVPSVNFASRYIANTAYLEKHHLSKSENLPELAGVILFDHIFHNADRTNNRKNLIVSPQHTGYKIYAIDNSHLFRSGRWTNKSVMDLSEIVKVYYYRLFGLLLTSYISPNDFIPYLEKFKAIDDTQIKKIMQSVPDEWWNNKEESVILEEYIRTRKGMADKIFFKICKYIPKSSERKQRLIKTVTHIRK